MTKNLSKIEGVIYSLPLEMAMNIFEKGKTVFVKYQSHEPTKKTEMKLQSGMKLYVYVSKANKSVIGEAIIKRITYLNLNEMLKWYKKDIMISEAELLLYAEGRELKKAQVLELKNITLYPKEIKVNMPITIAGAYVSTKNKKQVFSK